MKIHGMEGTSVYHTWCAMKRRCYNKNCADYNRYGGRGISVSEDWRNSFSSFYRDMGDRPYVGAQLDRINNNGNYEKSNCRWATPGENNHNRRDNKLTWPLVKMIRAMSSAGISGKYLSVCFGLSHSAVCRIIKNKTWIEEQFNGN
jgi:hypothetical protein